MADTTGRIPLWIIGTVAGIVVIGLGPVLRRHSSISSTISSSTCSYF